MSAFGGRSSLIFSARMREPLITYWIRKATDSAHRPEIRRVHAEDLMDGIIYLVGLIVIVMAILSFLGLH